VGNVFNDAELLLDAATYSGSGDLLDQSGNGHDATPSGATFLDHDGTNYVWQPGVTGNDCESLTAGIASTTLSTTWQARVMFDDLTPAADTLFFDTSAGTGSWVLGWYLRSDGKFQAYIRGSDAAFDFPSSSETLAAAGMVVDVVYDIKMTVVDIDTTTPDLEWFFKLPAATTWTQIGTTQSVTTAGGLNAASDRVNLHGSGAEDDAGLPGRIYSASLIADGITVVDFVSSDVVPGRTALDLDGTGDYASAPGTNDLDITGDLEIQWFGAPDDWTPAFEDSLVSKYTTTGNQRSYMLNLLAAGTLKFYWSENGTTAQANTSTVATGFANGSLGGVKAEFVAATETSTFYLSSDGGNSWQQLGDAVSVGGSASLNVGTAPLELGAWNGASGLLAGQVHRAIVKDGIDGATVFDHDFTDDTPGATRITNDAGHESWLELDGTGDYASAPDSTDYDVTNTLRLEVDIQADNYGTDLWYFLTKDLSPSNEEWRWRMESDETMSLVMSTDGSTADGSYTLETGVSALTDGERYQLRLDWRANNATGNSQADFYVKESGVWVLKDSDTNDIITGGLFSGTAEVRIGEDLPGRIYSATVIPDSAAVLEVDFTDEDYTAASGTITAGTGQTITLNANAYVETNEIVLNANAAVVPDGQLRIHDSTPTYLDLPGASGDYATAPLIGAASATVDIDYRARVTLDDVTPAANEAFIGSDNGDREFGVDTSGNLFTTHKDGSTVTATSSATLGSVGVTVGQSVWVRALVDTGSDTVDFYYSTDDVDAYGSVGWLDLGTQQSSTLGTVNAITTVGVGVGNTDTDADPLAGTCRQAVILYDSTVVFDADFTDLAPGVTSFTEDSSNAATVTLNGNAVVAGGSNKWNVNRHTSGYVTALVEQPMFVFDGTDDYLEIDDLSIVDSDDISVVVAYRNHMASNSTAEPLISSKANTANPGDEGFTLYDGTSHNAYAMISDGTTRHFDNAGTDVDSPFRVAGFVFTNGADIEAFQDGTGSGSAQSTSVTDTASANNVRIGRYAAAGTTYWEFELYAVAAWRRALTDAEILEASQRMAGTYTVTDPELSVEIGFNANPLDTSITWTDIVDDLQQLNLRRGRQFELNRFEAGTLTATINNQDGKYDPEYGYGVPYTNNIQPLKHIRVTTIDPSTPVGINNPILFRGYTEAWQQQGNKVYTTTLTAADTFKALNLLPLGDNYLTEILKDNPLGAWKLNETFGTSISDASGNSGTGTITHSAYTLDQGSPFQNAFGGSSMAVTAGATTGWITLPEAGEETLHQSQDGAYTFEAMIKPDSGASARTGYLYVSLPDGTAAGGIIVGITSGGEVTVTMAGQGNTFTSSGLTDDVWNHLVVVIKDSGLSHVFVNGTNTSGALFNSGVSFADVDGSQENRLLGWNSSNNNPFQGTASTVAVYDHALKPARILAHYNATLNGWPEQTLYDRFVSVLSYVNWPTLRQNLDTKTDSNLHLVAGDELTGESTLTYLASIAQSFGAEFFADTNGDLCLRSRDWRAENNTTTNTTVGDDPTSSEIGYNNIDLSADDQYTYTHVDATASNGRVFTVEGDDFNSATDLQRTFTAPSNRAGDDNIVQARVEWLAEVYQTTRTRIKTVSIPTRASAAALTQAVYREIGDRVTIKRRPPGGYIISFDAFIEAINHTIDNNLKRWNTTWQLSPAEPHISVLLVDTGIVGIGAVGEDVIGW